MKNLHLDWSKSKVKAMVRTRGPVKGCVAVLVSSKLGSEYGAVVCGKSADDIQSSIPPSVGIYSVMPSSDPEEVAAHVLSLWEIEEVSVEPYTVESDNIVFHKCPPDALLADLRNSAWQHLAEQLQVEIVETWGTATTA